jgi:hypothetical protein
MHRNADRSAESSIRRQAIEEFLPLLRPGDIITTASPGFLDIGHGAGSFAFRIAEAAFAAGVRPNVISGDMHQMSVAGPMFDPPTCLSKSLALGLSVRDVMLMATKAPARILGYEDRGTLRVGALADISLFRLHEGAFPLSDNTGAMRSGRQLLRNVETIVGGPERRAASPRAVWAERWDRGGANAHIRAFQCELISKGHTPEQICGCDRPTAVDISRAQPTGNVCAFNAPKQCWAKESAELIRSDRRELRKSAPYIANYRRRASASAAAASL